jgi:hypothetical protein
MRGKIPIVLPLGNDATSDRFLANYKGMAMDDLAEPFEGNRPARHQKLCDLFELRLRKGALRYRIYNWLRSKLKRRGP